MIAPRQIVVCFLCLLLAGWSAEATLLLQQASSQSTRAFAAKVSVADGGEADRSGTDADRDDDDSGDDSDDATAPTYQVVSSPAPARAAAPPAIATDEDEDEKSSGPHAAEEEKLKKAGQKAKSALAKNQQQQEQLKYKLKFYSDAQKSNQEIDASAKLVANETDSPAMASTLAHMWKEMRMFEVPSYAEHLQDELHKLQRARSVLKHKLNLAKDKLKAAQKKWAGEEEDEEEDAKGKAAKEEEDTNLSDAAIQKGAPALIGNVNFWTMSRKEKVSFLYSWMVYLIGGIAFAFLFSQARTRNPKMFAPAPRRDITRGMDDFSFSLFGCLGAPNVCVMGCCCPCLTWSDTIDKNWFLSYWKAFFVFFSLTLLYGFTCGIAPILVVVLGVYYRQKQRDSYEMETGTLRSVGCDVLAWLFCQPCAIIQEAREESVPSPQEP